MTIGVGHALETSTLIFPVDLRNGSTPTLRATVPSPTADPSSARSTPA